MYKKGTIVLVPFPFTDLTGKKVRPALIISNEKISRDVMVVFITSQKKLNERHSVAIQPDDHNGLKINSMVVCAKIATLDTKVILGELGKISEKTKNKVENEIKEVLGF